MRMARRLGALSLTLLAAAPCAPAATAVAPGAQRVLFVGNSLVYYNDLPRMTAVLAAAGGVALDVDMIAGAGTTMRGHLDRGVLRRELARTHYDTVVLQDRGGYPLCMRDDHDCAGSVAAMCDAAALVRAADLVRHLARHRRGAGSAREGRRARGEGLRCRLRRRRRGDAALPRAQPRASMARRRPSGCGRLLGGRGRAHACDHERACARAGSIAGDLSPTLAGRASGRGPRFVATGPRT